MYIYMYMCLLIISHTQPDNLTSRPLSVLTTRASSRSHLLPNIIFSTSAGAYYEEKEEREEEEEEEEKEEEEKDEEEKKLLSCSFIEIRKIWQSMNKQKTKTKIVPTTI